MLLYCYLLSVVICGIFGKSLPNNTAVLISKYAKVARWGQNDTQKSEGRSSGQTLWNHRSDVNVVSGQNLRKSPGVVYHYPVSRKSNEKTEHVPGIGEVIIEDRFNPKPYFRYGEIPQGGSEPSPPSPPPTFNSFPVFKPPTEVDAKPSTADSPSKPPSDLYGSPFTSYNPPSVVSSEDGPSYPPNVPDSGPPKSSDDSYSGPPSDSKEVSGYEYKPPDSPSPPAKPPAPSSGPPTLPPLDTMIPSHEMPPPNEMHHHYDGPPKHPPKSIDDVYYPPDDHPETIVDHPPMHHEITMDHPPIDHAPMAAPMDHAPMAAPMDHAPMAAPLNDAPPMDYPAPMHGKPMDMAEDDLSPPPADHEEPRFPPYLYDHNGYEFDHHDHEHHHVYEEVTHPPPTTTEKVEMEDERVNKGHYSYYYLGRKLWYIPLYFSVYFILYVTALIVKSIARHKIQFRHHFDDERKARTLDVDERIDEVHRNVTNAIERGKIKYMAM